MAQSSFKQYRFEDLEVWKLSMQILHETYQLLKTVPKSEVFGLSDQLKRAATSIALNIAEGSGQPTIKAFSLYLNRSKASLLERVACLKIANQEEFLANEDTEHIQELLKEEYFKLIARAKSLNY